MNIYGIGTDIVNVKRMKKSLMTNGPNFKKRIFSKNEITYCEGKKIHLHFMQKDMQLKKL